MRRKVGTIGLRIGSVNCESHRIAGSPRIVRIAGSLPMETERRELKVQFYPSAALLNGDADKNKSFTLFILLLEGHGHCSVLDTVNTLSLTMYY